MERIQWIQDSIKQLLDYLHASIATRPDLSAAVGVLSQFMANPGPEQWNAVKKSSSLH